MPLKKYIIRFVYFPYKRPKGFLSAMKNLKVDKTKIFLNKMHKPIYKGIIHILELEIIVHPKKDNPEKIVMDIYNKIIKEYPVLKNDLNEIFEFKVIK